ncbi:MAG: hypothetical protein A3D31_02105 [Candidatus Fluviicola riflensis]|nr:MAG: hypothetical protein CHH17_12930 [Candidatus Fluviicola riflensis]OGS78789.1 MAG: hypothetical protein A3D31_02105 [Candidatus Fluviicola riflensis]OGS86220.1 MAG: hypothetical protein A2724_01560 [Fluviicola sp. RIFCSPHIGHO2_01_FULL_43_53]OGS87662.1 MAG: hypothetical protein A3E30_16365 [Fluviicola sp. RIFCSPHIGHO2_12_FULL_43_24]
MVIVKKHKLMKQLMITSILLIMAVFSVNAQVDLPYNSGFENASDRLVSTDLSETGKLIIR